MTNHLVEKTVKMASNGTIFGVRFTVSWRYDVSCDIPCYTLLGIWVFVYHYSHYSPVFILIQEKGQLSKSTLFFFYPRVVPAVEQIPHQPNQLHTIQSRPLFIFKLNARQYELGPWGQIKGLSNDWALEWNHRLITGSVISSVECNDLRIEFQSQHSTNTGER